MTETETDKQIIEDSQERVAKAEWEERPARLTPTARKQANALREAGGGAAAETAREAMRREHGEVWLWLATQAPLVAGDGGRGELVREAEERGVQLWPLRAG